MGIAKIDDLNRSLEDDTSVKHSEIEVDSDFISSMRVFGDSLKTTVLGLAKAGNFELAKREMKFYQQQNRRVPGFEFRTKHYFAHCYDLIDAINNLKHIPNFENLRAAQQKQVRERIMTYGQDLSSILGRIDKVTNDLKIQDIRSTMWVIRSFTLCFAAVIFTLSIIEALTVVGSPLATVIDQMINWFIYIIES